MKMVATIAVIVFGMFAAVMGVVSYGLYDDNKKLMTKNQLLSELYDTSMKNVDILERTIDEQNQRIDKFRSDSLAFELKVNELNSEVVKLNGEKEEYAKMDPAKEDSSEEAIGWLKSQASSL